MEILRVALNPYYYDKKFLIEKLNRSQYTFQAKICSECNKADTRLIYVPGFGYITFC